MSAGLQTPLRACAEVALADAGRFLPPICRHLEEHGLVVEELGPAAARLRGRTGLGRMRVEPGRLRLEVEAPELPGLLSMRAALAGHLLEFARDAAGAIVWTGDGALASAPAEFRRVRVRACRDLSPAMRRIRFEAEDLARFDTDEHLHCKLLFPPDPAAPQWPTLGPDGLIRWPAGEAALAVRKYTIRRISAAEGWLDVDFVLHADRGVGSAFAERARAGDVVGMIGPGGLGVRPAAWTLLAGDETALPAIARILERLPADARGLALIEVADAGGRQVLAAPEGVEVRWLPRGGAPAGTTRLLADAVRALVWPSEPAEGFAWVGCEFAAFREIRSHIRRTLGWPAHRQHVVAYWRRTEPGPGG